MDGLYAATWSKQARQISLSMPGGASLYSVGSTISFDPTDGSKKYDPYQTEEDDRKHGPFVNTNGVYVFDVVSLSYYTPLSHFGEKLNDFILAFQSQKHATNWN